MRIKRSIAAAIATLALAGFSVAACGDDDGGGGGVQNDVADEVIELLEGQGVDVDEDCVRDITDQLSEEDAEALADAGVDGSPELSADAEALGEQLFECVEIAE